METEIFQDLMQYIKVHNPELIVNTSRNFSITQFVSDKVANVAALMTRLQKEGKPPYIIKDRCMEELTKDLLPSRADYIKAILESEFREEYERFQDGGIMTYEVVNLIEYCGESFEGYEFNVKNQGNRFLRYAVVAQIADYLIDRVH